MTNPENPKKKRRTLLEGFNNVPKLLEEARQAVDEVSQAVQEQSSAGEIPAAPLGRKGAATGPNKRKAAPRKESAKEGNREKKPSRPPDSHEQPAVPAAAAASDVSGGPQLGLADFGITVKHAIPGRLRLRLYQMLYNEALAEKLPSLLAAVPGVTSAEASTNTGSLLITYNPEELAAAEGRRGLAGVMQQFFPGLDTTDLLKLML